MEILTLDVDIKPDQQNFGKLQKRSGVETLQICATQASEGEKGFL